MSFDPETAAIRFGCGLSPQIAPHGSVAEVLASLDLPDEAAERFHIDGFPKFRDYLKYNQQLTRARRQAETQAEKDEFRDAIRQVRRRAAQSDRRWVVRTLQRRTWSTHPFRERLTAFWGDHFTAAGKGGVLRYGQASYIESAIRPNLAKSFEDMLRAAVTHPLMLHYLDQDSSTGPNALRAKKNKRLGLNENMAREVLELHTLGVDGPYTQSDVNELAKLLAGLRFNAVDGMVYNQAFAEPGPEKILGRRYGNDTPSLRDVHAVLRDLARHPATAAHISRKLATHFVGDTPSAALVGAMQDRYVATNGDLWQLYAAMLEHPDAWDAGTGNVKQPLDLIGSALRALAVPPEALESLSAGQINNMFLFPMRLMGQDWGRPGGPDGWPEEDTAWVSPQGLAARLRWCMSAPNTLVRDIPDPRSFATVALGGRVTDAVAFAAKAAETRWEGVGLILASPAFQTM